MCEFTVSVVIPTYNRPLDLTRNLASLAQCANKLAEIVIVLRPEDAVTQEVIRDWSLRLPNLREAYVELPGALLACNRGLEVARGDIIAFLDDDAEVTALWLEILCSHYKADEHIGAVGGRDIIVGNHPEAKELLIEKVGQISWFGRTVGNHHRGRGAPREVQFLKGVNMSFRKSAVGNLRFDERMRGRGTQIHYEIAFCLALRRQKWKIIYDPALQVVHHLAPRHDNDQRGRFNAEAVSNIVHNHTLAVLEHLPPHGKLAYLIWGVLVGTRGEYGAVQVLRHIRSLRHEALQRGVASWKGRAAGVWTYLSSGRREQVSATDPPVDSAERC